MITIRLSTILTQWFGDIKEVNKTNKSTIKSTPVYKGVWWQDFKYWNYW
ncbi:hypothetical protein KTC96_24285 (plasmid) [Clostridium estertheticum]|nr:hypothetical protein [Clostridium estertheticum]MBX4262903.1 hypothetical protein [Clostridium estertheticum]WLC72795.1 hypothetical protein KTC96_23135 [Clostridium estertheticum]WLC72866.1 hypothetical protein KTC96_23540 [Clostridium estertheticum]WLC73106.1 hypothetical protein KTC96_24285 [Clostridium estertheticum]